MARFSVTKNGIPLDKSMYTWDESTKTFTSNEVNYLVLDFNGISGVTFRTGSKCMFFTDSNCTFDTGYSCTFDTGHGCKFNAGSECMFFTGTNCTFATGHNCIFKATYSCTFKTGRNCFVIRNDINGVTEIPFDKTIKLNNYGVVGYTIIEEKKEIASCVGKIVEIDGKKYKLVDA